MDDSCKCYKANCPNRKTKPDDVTTLPTKKTYEAPKTKTISKDGMTVFLDSSGKEVGRCFCFV